MLFRSAYVCIGLLAVAFPAAAGLIPATFAGPAFQIAGIVSSDWQVDTSGLVLIDVPDGFKFTGIVTVTHIGSGGFGGGGLAQVAAFRPLVGSTATPIAQVSATITTSGGIDYAGLLNTTGITLVASDSYCNTNTAEAGITTFLVGDGFYSSSADTGGQCSNNVFSPLYLFQTLTFDAASTLGGGTATFDLGNSSNSQATAPAAVPEPATLAPMALALAAVLRARFRRRRRSTRAA